MADSDGSTDMKTDIRGFQPLVLSHRPDFQEILTCVLNISKSEARTYEALLRQQNADVNTLADKLDRSANTVREQLSALQEKRLVIRDTRITEQGRYYTYEALAPTEAKQMLHEVIEQWAIYVSNRLDDLADNPMGDPITYRSATASDSTATVPQQLLHGEHPSLRDIATYVFGLKGPVLKQYLALLDYPGSTARELAEAQDLARSTVSGRLNVLQERGLACPVGREIENSARIAYEYVPRPLDEVKSAMKNQLDGEKNQLEGEWTEHAKQTVDEFYESVE
jgi:predicted transcriptional regulator